MIEIDQVSLAFSFDYWYDEQVRDYVSLIDLYTAPGERTEAEQASIGRKAARLLNDDTFVKLNRATVNFDNRFKPVETTWKVFIGTMLQMGFEEEVKQALAKTEDNLVDTSANTILL